MAQFPGLEIIAEREHGNQFVCEKKKKNQIIKIPKITLSTLVEVFGCVNLYPTSRKL